MSTSKISRKPTHYGKSSAENSESLSGRGKVLFHAPFMTTTSRPFRSTNEVERNFSNVTLPGAPNQAPFWTWSGKRIRTCVARRRRPSPICRATTRMRRPRFLNGRATGNLNSCNWTVFHSLVGIRVPGSPLIMSHKTLAPMAPSAFGADNMLPVRMGLARGSYRMLRFLTDSCSRFGGSQAWGGKAPIWHRPQHHIRIVLTASGSACRLFGSGVEAVSLRPSPHKVQGQDLTSSPRPALFSLPNTTN